MINIIIYHDRYLEKLLFQFKFRSTFICVAYYFFISISDHRSRNRFHHPSFRPLQKRELLYLSAQMIRHTTENGISASDTLSSSSAPPPPSSLSLSLILPSILVNRNRRFCGNDNTRQWNRTRSRKRTNCWDNNYSRNWPRAGRDRWGRERDRLPFVYVTGVIIDTRSGHYSVAHLSISSESILLN